MQITSAMHGTVTVPAGTNQVRYLDIPVNFTGHVSNYLSRVAPASGDYAGTFKVLYVGETLPSSGREGFLGIRQAYVLYNAEPESGDTLDVEFTLVFLDEREPDALTYTGA